MKSIIYIFFFIGTLFSYSNGLDSASTSQDHSLMSVFKQGHLSGNIRSYTMNTIYPGQQLDYYASAMGASIHFDTHPLYGFSVGMNGIFVYKLFSNDLNEVDPLRGKRSSFERQLFDIEHDQNFSDLDRLEELYLKYQYKHLTVTLGKMEIETPMVNLNDNRMKPKVFSGIKLNYDIKNIRFKAAFFNKSSPRSTTHWYTIEEGIGIYNNGVLSDGSPADYKGTLKSKGLGIIGIKSKYLKNTQIDIWDYYLDNICNTSFLKAQYKTKKDWFFGALYLSQFPLGNGGSEDIEVTYYNPEEITHAFSSRIGKDLSFMEVQLNATYITESGKFIFPREYGVDPFFTFVPRSQLEGYGDMQSLGITLKKKIKNMDIAADWNRSLFSNDLSMNKYNTSSYDQVNLNMIYHCHNNLEGLDVRVLVLTRKSIENKGSSDQSFHQLNLIANFNF